MSGIIQLDVFLMAVSYLVLFGSVMRHDLPSVPNHRAYVDRNRWILGPTDSVPEVTLAYRMVKCYQRSRFKVAQNSFQHFPRRRF